MPTSGSIERLLLFDNQSVARHAKAMLRDVIGRMSLVNARPDGHSIKEATDFRMFCRHKADEAGRPCKLPSLLNRHAAT
jgi:hypothetical protein